MRLTGDAPVRRTASPSAPAAIGAARDDRISHLKREHGLKRSRLTGEAGTRTWVGWGVLTHNVDAYVHYAVRRG